MENNLYGLNIDSNAVMQQYAKEQEEPKQRTQFELKNYLGARLGKDEVQKVLTIRLLPFSQTELSPFHKVHTHTIRVNKELNPSGWKTFICPTHNSVNGEQMGDKCPFCETSIKARELSRSSIDEPTKKKYDDVAFANRVSSKWIVRCIERGHEDDGVKFWMFTDSRKKDGVYDKIMNIANMRAESAKRKGNNYSIFDLQNGMDLIITLTRTSDGKTNIQVLDDGTPSKLTDDVELGKKWLMDEKKWTDVYTVKPYDYMYIVGIGGIPYYDKVSGKFIDKAEFDEAKEKAETERLNEVLTEPKIDYTKIASPQQQVQVVNVGIPSDNVATTVAPPKPEDVVASVMQQSPSVGINDPIAEDDLPF